MRGKRTERQFPVVDCKSNHMRIINKTHTHNNQLLPGLKDGIWLNWSIILHIFVSRFLLLLLEIIFWNLHFRHEQFYQCQIVLYRNIFSIDSFFSIDHWKEIKLFLNRLNVNKHSSSLEFYFQQKTTREILKSSCVSFVFSILFSSNRCCWFIHYQH